MIAKNILIALSLAGVACVVLYGILCQKVIFYQDTSSGTVKSVHYYGFIPLSSGIRFQTAAYNPKRASWQNGVTYAFPTLSRDGDGFVYRQGNYSALVSIVRSDYNTLVYAYRERGKSFWKTNRTEGPIQLGTNTIDWSYHSNGCIVVYADEYLFKPSSNLYEIAFRSRAGSLERAWEADPDSLEFIRFPWEVKQ
jgi:hypothetical protein